MTGLLFIAFSSVLVHFHVVFVFALFIFDCERFGVISFWFLLFCVSSGYLDCVHSQFAG